MVERKPPADVVNLRRARKARERAAQGDAAAQNRVTHGVSKAVRSLADRRREKASRDLDGAKRDQDGNGSES